MASRSSKLNARLAEMLKILQFSLAKSGFNCSLFGRIPSVLVCFLRFVWFLRSRLHFHFVFVVLAVHLKGKKIEPIRSL